jgi:hypothetical protein
VSQAHAIHVARGTTHMGGNVPRETFDQGHVTFSETQRYALLTGANYAPSTSNRRD